MSLQYIQFGAFPDLKNVEAIESTDIQVVLHPESTVDMAKPHSQVLLIFLLLMKHQRTGTQFLSYWPMSGVYL